MASRASDLYDFGPYRLDVDRRALTREHQPVALAPKTFDLLLLMVRNPGRAFSRRDLMAALWPDTFVEEANLSFQISTLRKALGDPAADWIETVPKHGYRFSADVTVVPADRPSTHIDGTADHVRPAEVSRGASPKPWLAGVVLMPLALAAAVFVRGLPNLSRDPDVVARPLTAYHGRATVPSLSPDGSQVAFSWSGVTQDNHDIYVKLVGPGEPWRLTTNPAHDDQAAWSPDGAQIAFLRFQTEASVADVMVVPALGGAERRIAAGVSHCQGSPRGRAMSNLAWTRDGKWLAIGGQPSPTEPGGIWLLEVGGHQRRPLTAAPEQRRGAVGDISPTFSPDGRWMAFIREHTLATNAIYVLPLSTDWRASGAPVKVAEPARRGVVGLSWTPDSRALIFSSGGHFGQSRIYRVELTAAGEPAGPVHLMPFGEQAQAISIAHTGRMVYSAQFRDTTFTKLDLTRSSEVPADAGFAGSTLDEHTPNYSPDGARLAFASTRSGAEEIWISNPDGSNPRQMTFMDGPQCANPQWAPDGRTILFNARLKGSADLYTLDPATGELTQLTSDPQDEVEARWSRNGRSIYFASDRTGRFETWKMPAGGGTAIQVTRGGGLAATESSDGAWVYYAKDLSWSTKIWRVSTAGGQEVPVADRLTYTQNFAVGDRGLYLVAVGDTPGQLSIDFVEFSTGKRTTLAAIRKPFWFGVALSHDQQSFLYTTVESAGSNLVVVDKVR